MFVYRFEHMECTSRIDPLHGPGTMWSAECQLSDTYSGTPSRPPFGLTLSPPYRIKEWERCAVTLDQFTAWWSRPDYAHEYPGWALIEYELNDSGEGTEWNFDSHQIVFDTYASRRVGRVSVADVMALAEDDEFASAY